MQLEGGGGDRLHLVGERPVRQRQGHVEPAAQHGPGHRERLVGHRPTSSAGPATHPADVEGQRQLAVLLAAADAAVELGGDALCGQQLEEERSRHQRRVALVDGAQTAHEHVVEPRCGLAVLGELLDRLEQRRGPTQAGQVLTGAAERLDGLGLGDDVELAAPLVQLQRRVGAGLQPGPELRAGAAHPLGDGADLARLPGHQHHDAIGFAELVGAQHHRRVAVEAHPVGLIR